MPEVSVIIPNYNHSAFLKQRIDSILEQSYRDFELIILDDCSTDSSKAVIELYRGSDKVSHIVYNEVNSGSTFRQWKKGIGLSEGNCIWIAESDDIADREFLAKMIKPFHNDSKTSLVFCQSYKCDENGVVDGTWIDHTQDITVYNWAEDFCVFGTDFTRNCMLFKNAIPNASAVMFNKKYLNEQSIDVSMTLNGDWLFYIRQISKGNVCYLSQPLNYFRYHNNKGSSKNIQNYNNVKEYYLVLSYIFANFELSADLKQKALDHVFGIWLYQSNHDIPTMFKNHFRVLYGRARQADRTIFLKIMKVFTRQVLQKIKSK